MNLCLWADQLSVFLSIHMTIMLLISSVKYVRKRLISPLHTASKKHLHNYSNDFYGHASTCTPKQSWLQQISWGVLQKSVLIKVCYIWGHVKLCFQIWTELIRFKLCSLSTSVHMNTKRHIFHTHKHYLHIHFSSILCYFKESVTLVSLSSIIIFAGPSYQRTDSYLISHQNHVGVSTE
jgi:hypothetical protein